MVCGVLSCLLPGDIHFVCPPGDNIFYVGGGGSDGVYEDLNVVGEVRTFFLSEKNTLSLEL